MLVCVFLSYSSHLHRSLYQNPHAILPNRCQSIDENARNTAGNFLFFAILYFMRGNSSNWFKNILWYCQLKFNLHAITHNQSEVILTGNREVNLKIRTLVFMVFIIYIFILIDFEHDRDGSVDGPETFFNGKSYPFTRDLGTWFVLAVYVCVHYVHKRSR